MSKKRWFWGIFFILAAILLVVSQLGMLTVKIGFFQIILTIFLAAFLIKSLLSLSISGSVFSLAFLLIIYAAPLKISVLSPWTILLVALLLDIGLGMIFRSNFKIKNKYWKFDFPNKSDYKQRSEHKKNISWDFGDTKTNTSSEGEEVTINGKMNSSIRYVKSENLRKVKIDTSLSDLKIYFTDAQIKDELELVFSSSLSNIDLYFPNDWQVVDEIDSIWAEIDDSNRGGTGRAKVYLRGSLSASELSIHYI